MPSTSHGIVPGVTPVHESIPLALQSSIVTIKQEHPSRPIRRKRIVRPTLAEGDFVAVKIHKFVRSDGDRKGKLVPKAEGPYLLQGFTDNTQQRAIIAEANNVTWTKRVADLSKWV